MQENNNIENNKKLKENPFGVPQGYFEGLEGKLKQIPTESEAKVVELKPKMKGYKLFMAAATVAILIASAWLYWPNGAKSETTLNADDILVLNEFGYLPLEEYTLLDVFEEDELDEITFEDYEIDYYELTQPTIIEEYYLLTEEI